MLIHAVDACKVIDYLSRFNIKHESGTYMPYAVPNWCSGRTLATNGQSELAKTEYARPITTLNKNEIMKARDLECKNTMYQVLLSQG